MGLRRSGISCHIFYFCFDLVSYIVPFCFYINRDLWPSIEYAKANYKILRSHTVRIATESMFHQDHYFGLIYHFQPSNSLQHIQNHQYNKVHSKDPFDKNIRKWLKMLLNLWDDGNTLIWWDVLYLVFPFHGKTFLPIPKH